MKTLLTFISFLLLFGTSYTQHKSIEIATMTYDVIVKKATTVLINDVCVLYSTGDQSFFYSENRVKYNKIMAQKFQEAMNNGGKINLSAQDGQMLTNFLPFSILKDFTKNRSVFIENVDDQHFGYIKDTTLRRRWKFEPDTLTINKLLCRKATFKTASVEVVAWYCPAIPIQDGPFTYGGLPGLIIKVSNNFGWEAVLTSINYKNQLKNVQRIPAYTAITEERLNKLKKQNLESLLGSGNNPGQKVSLQKAEN